VDSSINLDDLTRMIGELNGKDREEMLTTFGSELVKPFIPNPGPQTDAMLSKADILLYGGQAGGGKSALEVGCAAVGHQNSLILRREATQLDGLIDFSREILSDIGRFNGGHEKLWTLSDGKKIKMGGMNMADDWRKYAGIPRDYMAFDEAGEFLKEQVFSLIGWLRTTIEGQRCRVILGSNPPRGGDGAWMVEEFSPWLDPASGVKAVSGQLLWAIVVRGKTEWVDGPGIYKRQDEDYEAMSRTFIPASLSDNPFLAMDTGYKARLQSLPEPLRSQLLHGDFTTGQGDHEWQVIPSDWVRQAQDRWFDQPPGGEIMTALACDVAQGGPDKTQIQSKYKDWFSRFASFPGSETPDGPAVAAEIVKVMRDRCRVVVDAGGGYGGDALTQLAHADIDCFGFNGASGSTGSSRNGIFRFKNLRAQAIWQFREALDPEYGSKMALPPDPELRADLCSFRYTVTQSGRHSTVLVGPKDEIKKRLGRSPDKGDTTIMLHSSHISGLARPKAGTDRRRHTRQTRALT